jgi:HK97 gp10 family phage protein
MKDMEGQLKDLSKAFMQYSVKADDATSAGLLASAIVVQGDAIRLSPVDIGLLRKSILRRVVKATKGHIAEVGTNVEYAPFQEFGTSKMEPQPFLTPALNMNKAKIGQIIAKAISGVKA